MKDLDYLFELFSKSIVTVIGYTSKDEPIKDCLLDKLDVHRIGKIDSDFNPKQVFRDIKLSSLFDEIDHSRYFHLDVSDISNKNTFEYHRVSSGVIRSIRSEISNGYLFEDGQKPPFRLIITAPLYKSGHELNFKGGSRILYSADLALVIKERSLGEKLTGESKSIRIIKNRFNQNFEISLRNLDNYNYICNYEHSK
jgi:hypothetical protein